MVIYDLPTYVLHVLAHFWMFAVKITEWIFSLKSLGLWTWTWTHLPIVWDKVPNKSGFLTPSLISDALSVPKSAAESKFEKEKNKIISELQLKVSNT